MSPLVIILLVLLLFGGGIGYYGPRNEWAGPQYGGGLVGLLLLLLLILFLTGNLHR